MKRALILFFFCSTLAAAGPGNSFAQAPAAPEVAEPSKEAPAPARKRKGRRKAPRVGTVSADGPAAGPAAAAPPPAAAKAPGAVEPRRVNSLLFGTMERLETLAALHENLRLRVSEDTLKKISEMEKAADKVAAAYFKAGLPGEGEKPYRELLDGALRSVKALKDVKDRVRPEESEEAILLCRDLNAAIDGELAGAKLSAAAPAPAEPPAQEAAQAAPAEPAGDAAALSALADLRKAIEAYKAKETKYPKSLGKLTPKYLPGIPEIQVADHPATREALEINSSDYDDAVFQAITDTGKWLYFTDKKSKYYGLVLIDCSHKNSAGVELYKIGQGN